MDETYAFAPGRGDGVISNTPEANRRSAVIRGLLEEKMGTVGHSTQGYLLQNEYASLYATS